METCYFLVVLFVFQTKALDMVWSIYCYLTENVRPYLKCFLNRFYHQMLYQTLKSMRLNISFKIQHFDLKNGNSNESNSLNIYIVFVLYITVWIDAFILTAN